MNKKTKKGPAKPLGASAAPNGAAPHGQQRLLATGIAGLLVLVMVVMVLSLLAGVRLQRPVRLYVAGEIAGYDVKAADDLLLLEKEATERKRAQVSSSQPPVFDLAHEPVEQIASRAREAVELVTAAAPEDLEQVRWQVAEGLDAEVSSRSLFLWRKDEFRTTLNEAVLPWLNEAMAQGVVSDRRLFSPYRQGIVIRDLAGGEEVLNTDPQQLRDLGDLQSDLEDFLRGDLNHSIRFRKAVMDLLRPLMVPNLTLNQEASQARRQAATDAVEPVYTQIKKGEIVVRQGERVDEEQQRRLQALVASQRESFLPMKSGGVFAVGLLILVGLSLSGREPRARSVGLQDAVFLGSVLLVFGVLAKVLEAVSRPLAQGLVFADLDPALVAYTLPVAGAVGVAALFFPTSLCLFVAMLAAFLCGQLAGGGLELVLFYFLTSMFGVFFIKRAQNRLQLVGCLAPLLGTQLASWAGVAMLGGLPLAEMGFGAGASMLGGMLSLMTVLAVSPIAEHVFGYTSRFKLMELMNLEQPLLRELMVNAPGTYHHSLIVANMVESGARSIGANPLLAKVSALYHDIGKLKNPHYFIENQFGQANKHDKLAPSMSALVLISHAKKGVELAREHKLGPEIIDVIQQHHGTSLMSYFYRKALEQAEQKGGEMVREEDYRYPGPKPQTKEAGLILLADAVEASSRTLVDPTPSRLKGHIQKIIRAIYNEGQLDDSELTLKDLNLLGDAFMRVMAGMFHHRIEYPGGDKAEQEGTVSSQPLYPMHQ